MSQDGQILKILTEYLLYSSMTILNKGWTLGTLCEYKGVVVAFSVSVDEKKCYAS